MPGGHSAGMGAIGKRIKKLRTDLGLSQREVSERVGVTQEAISGLERFPERVPNSDTLQRLAKFFQVDAEWLLTGKGQQSPISSLTEGESELILLFRAMSQAGKDYVLGRARDIYRDEFAKPEEESKTAAPGREHRKAPH